MTEMLRGNKIYCLGKRWFYCASGDSVEETWREVPCGFCKKENVNTGHDSCLRSLPYLMNACCGHGNTGEAYVQFLNGVSIKGILAKLIIIGLKLVKKWKNKN